jgi:hypothetical protein
MMSPKLEELFQASKGEPIVWNGQLVQMMYDLDGLQANNAIRIWFITASSVRPQALRVTAKGGRLGVNGQLLNDVVLWKETAPDEVELSPHPDAASGVMSVSMWNAWKDDAGTTHAWIGNAGLIVDQRGDDLVILRCSDGYIDPSFDDLVVEVRIVTKQVSSTDRRLLGSTSATGVAREMPQSAGNEALSDSGDTAG